jgi:hypothetical protein
VHQRIDHHLAQRDQGVVGLIVLAQRAALLQCAPDVGGHEPVEPIEQDDEIASQLLVVLDGRRFALPVVPDELQVGARDPRRWIETDGEMAEHRRDGVARRDQSERGELFGLRSLVLHDDRQP